MAAKGRAAESAQQNRAWLAWHIAALPRLKKFPALDKLLGRRRRVRSQAPDELLANIKRMFM
ncbi:MAG: hypothetical protein EON91_02710 [Brevundimonas sp.]|uniref:hypothetical protein n=1 Tax=Brevundimonas sp. TaxID=1871086 RepID=UPI00120E51A7|nr:hypothetical protein [Brevundimonas sp.]RZJ19125.1 MAG: hypothetical protein EON91_02710 [Brevundimonas sp.]